LSGATRKKLIYKTFYTGPQQYDPNYHLGFDTKILAIEKRGTKRRGRRTGGGV